MKPIPRTDRDRFIQRFNRKQLIANDLFNRYRPEIILLDGSVRSGKTLEDIVLFAATVYQDRDKGYNGIMTGHSLGALQRNVLDPMKEWLGIDTKLNARNQFSLFGNTMCCFGGANRDSHEVIQGMTAKWHYGNELTLQHPNVVKEVLARCSEDGAQFFWEMNPGPPSHHLHKRYIERAIANGNTPELVRVNFNLYDNARANGGFLSDKYIKRLEADYTGIWRRKYINGEWCAIEGQIYFLEELQYYDEPIERILDGAVVHAYMDPATGSTKKSGCFVSLIIGAMKNDRFYVLDVVVRKITPPEVIKTAGEKLQQYTLAKFAIEDNFSQDEYVVKPLRAAFPWAPIVGQSSREDKLSRLIGMHPTVTQKVYFPARWLHEKNSDGWLLLQQLCNITKERTDKAESDEEFLDGPDGLEGWIRTFRGYTSTGGFTQRVGGRKINAEW